MNISVSQLRAAVAVPTVVAGLVLSSLAGAAIASGSPASGSAGTASVRAAAPAAPEPAGSASTFLLYMFPTGQGLDPSACTGIGLNYSTDPYIDRRNCGFATYTVTGPTGTVTSELYAEGAATPFATPETAAGDPGEYQTTIVPDNSWPAGKIRLLVKDGSGPIGEYFFFYNALRATVAAPGSTSPGADFTVNGTIQEHTGGTAPMNTGVPAQFSLQVSTADGVALGAPLAVTAASNGTFSKVVPGSVTAGVTAGSATNYQTTLRVSVLDATFDDTDPVPPPATGEWAAVNAGSTGHTIVVPATDPTVLNSFVSSVGWVKPGETYPSRIVVTNPTTASVTPTVELSAPTGSTFVSATGPGTHPVAASAFVWSPGAIPVGESRTLVLGSKAAPLAGAGSLDTIVWRDLSSTAVLKVGAVTKGTSVSHGPKVIPPNETYETARYGDRPFPIVPVQYTDRPYQATHSGNSLEAVINDPTNEGSTFNLFQEMSLGQLFPNGTVPSAGIGSKDFTYAPGFDFSRQAIPGNTCKGATLAGTEPTPNPLPYMGTPAYPERITEGVYNLPGQTEYYGSDSNGSAVVGSAAGVGALQAIDSGCGDTGKLVYDAAALADPEIDYSDFDTDKDGVVDFFMVVFAGCGGNGGSQLSVAGCDYPGAPYDNIWPHSSSLENGYSDPVTGLPGFTTDDQLKNLEGQPLWYEDTTRATMTTTDLGPALKVFVRVGPYNVNPETAIDFASVISHEYGHSLGLPDFYSTGGRETYGDWNLMATDKSHNIDAFGRQELGWVVPRVLDSSRNVTAFKDSKEDIGQITWQRPDGSAYTLTDGTDGTVHNSEMYVAKLPGRTLLEASAFTPSATSEGASASHLWWSGSGNDFGCTPTAGRNFDLSIPQLATLSNPAATATLSFKSRWDIEWDFDYGYVLTTKDGGTTYASHPSLEGFTSSNTDPAAANPNNVACQATYDNGLTGTSGSYQAGTEAVDRKAGNTPAAVFLTDSYDISDLTGEANGALRFSYSSDPGLARPGWFIDDVKVTVDPDGAAGPAAPYDVLVTDFETSGGPDDSRVFNGGCRESLTTASRCTLGWKYLKAGAKAAQDHAYYLEMRDRSGFDLDGNGQADRGAPEFQAGLYLAYTDEAHGYGNAGTDSPPAQSPLDSVPQPGNETPNLNDAAFTAATDRKTFSDSAATPHVDNYLDPSTDSGNWEFGFDCLGFSVQSLSGETAGPQEADGDLTGDVTFSIGSGCGEFDYGYTGGGGGGPTNTAPTAAAQATPATVEAGTQVSLTSTGTTDAETPANLDYSWDFGNGGGTKDASTKTAKVTYTKAGTFTATLTVTDPQGLSDTATVVVTVKDSKPVAKLKISPKKPFITTKIKLDGSTSTGLPGLTYSWDFGDGGSKKDATGKTVTPTFKKPGYRTVRLTVKDSKGRTSTAKQKLLVRRAVSCNGKAVARTGSWRVTSSLEAPKGDYCDNLGKGAGQDTLTYRFTGPQLDVYFGTTSSGGRADVFIDGVKKGTISFTSGEARLRFKGHKVITGLSNGRHTVRLVVLSGTAYLDSFITIK